MERNYAAIGHFYNEEGYEVAAAPVDKDLIIKEVRSIVACNPTGSILSEDEITVLRSYLPAIGCEEISSDGNGSQQGKEVVTVKRSDCGMDVELTADLSVTSQWEQYHDRKEWIGHSYVKKTGGESLAKEILFKFNFFSVGVSPEGKWEVLYNKTYERVFNDALHLDDFNGGNVAEGTRIDISKHIQWGFFIDATCEIRTTQGTLIA